ncbi:MAG: hypothetical protein IJ330_03925, partial [Oscillospiraceae bacterium]|nr:hypothetical protein [Oscillospiraceae bacterium]
IYHEFFHSTVPLTSNDMGSFVEESITMILNDEYYSRNLNTYQMGDDRVIYIKMLMETIGTDKVLESYSKNDWRIIETELLKINPDSSIPNRIRELMDKYTEIFVANNFDRITANREAESVKNELAEIMIDYYETKYPNNEESVFYVYDAHFMQRANWRFRKTYKVYFNKERIGEDNEKIIYGS